MDERAVVIQLEAVLKGQRIQRHLDMYTNRESRTRHLALVRAETTEEFDLFAGHCFRVLGWQDGWLKIEDMSGDNKLPPHKEASMITKFDSVMDVMKYVEEHEIKE